MSNPDAATASATTQPAELQRHPIRGILWGLMMGIGLSVVLVVTKVISLDLTMMILVVVIALFAGVLWSTIGPAKAPTGPPPVTMMASAPPTSSRFDDFPGDGKDDFPDHANTDDAKTGETDDAASGDETGNGVAPSDDD